MIDGKDLKILKLLQENARIPNSEIARKLKLAPSVVFERLKKLEQKGVIKAYEARLDPRLLNKTMLAFISVRSDEQVGGIETARQLAKIPEVQEVHHISGEDCYLVKMRVADTQELARIMREQFGKIKTIRSTSKGNDEYSSSDRVGESVMPLSIHRQLLRLKGVEKKHGNLPFPEIDSV
jgi:Lrp/AsnC family leucine-responsive transcriptional regulator